MRSKLLSVYLPRIHRLHYNRHIRVAFWKSFRFSRAERRRDGILADIAGIVEEFDIRDFTAVLAVALRWEDSGRGGKDFGAQRGESGEGRGDLGVEGRDGSV